MPAGWWALASARRKTVSFALHGARLGCLSRSTIMTNHNIERLRSHQNNVRRYSRLLATHLTDIERGYIERRLSEERRCVEALLREEFPYRLSARSTDGSPNGPATNTTALLRPADAFVHPMDVVEDCDLTLYEKRAILSSWAADTCAVKDFSRSGQCCPEPGVSFDLILDALRALNPDAEPQAKPVPSRRARRNKAENNQSSL